MPLEWVCAFLYALAHARDSIPDLPAHQGSLRHGQNAPGFEYQYRTQSKTTQQGATTCAVADLANESDYALCNRHGFPDFVAMHAQQAALCLYFQ